jgi:creatinine amidohydrolase
MSDSARDIFAGTIAEMTWYEVEKAAKEGAVLLWAFGVIEQHGPHLPTGTDVYLPSSRLRDVKAELAQRGTQALIVPPYYWGVNVVSGAFPASYRVRPEIMRELVADVFCSLETDGFSRVFCFSGHGDALHNRTIWEAIGLGRERTKMDIGFVIEDALAARLGFSRDDPRVALHPEASVEDAPFRFMQIDSSSPSAAIDGAKRYVDVHAGCWETSMMMVAHPELVREELRVGLKSTDYGPDDLAEWRHGFERARKKTPLGYFGDPAAATRDEGLLSAAIAATRAADAIEARIAKPTR